MCEKLEGVLRLLERLDNRSVTDAEKNRRTRRPGIGWGRSLHLYRPAMRIFKQIKIGGDLCCDGREQLSCDVC